MPAKSSIGTSAVALTGTSTPVRYGVLVKAADGNSGTVYVGYADTVTANSADATDGIPLAAGASLAVPADKLPNRNATDVYLIASGAGQKVFYEVDAVGPAPLGSPAAAGSGSTTVVGAAAHDAAVSGNPLLLGGEARSTNPTAVASGDAVRLIADLIGRLVVAPYATPERSVDGTASATDTANTSVIAAPGAGLRIYVTSVVVSNESSTDTAVLLKSATTTRLRLPAPNKGGCTLTFPVPLRLGDNEALQFAAAAGVTTVYVSAAGYVGP